MTAVFSRMHMTMATQLIQPSFRYSLYLFVPAYMKLLLAIIALAAVCLAQFPFGQDLFEVMPGFGARFSDKIISYDVHTYFYQSWPPSRDEGFELRQRLAREFSDDIKAGKVRVHGFIDRPIGPHPYGMWECDFSSPEMFSKVVPWYVLS